MDRGTAILLTLVAYQLVLLGIGLFAQRRTRDAADFFLGGRRLGPLVAAISASASSSSAWTLLGVSGYAYLYGLSALWLFPACVGGFAVNWFLIAPRLRRKSGDALTLSEYLAGPVGSPGRQAILNLASIIILLCMLTYVAFQFLGAGISFEEAFADSDLQMSRVTAILIGGAIVAAYTLLGGFWAVSITDTLQGLLMALTSAILPLGALIAVGGFGSLAESLQAVPGETYLSITREFSGALAIGFVLGLFGITVNYPGQPHVVNRFMALRDEAALRRARLYAIAWAVVVYSGMILLGLCGRALVELGSMEALGEAQHEAVFITVTNELFHPVIAGVMIAAVLSAIMSTADSQLLVAASTVSHDMGAGARSVQGLRRSYYALGAAAVVTALFIGGTDVVLVLGSFAILCFTLGFRARPEQLVLLNSRLVVLVLSAAAVIAATLTEQDIFGTVLFAFSAMGCSFGPILVLKLWVGPVPPGATLMAMATGFGLSVLGYALNLTGVAVEERILPFIVALLIALVPTLRLRARMAAESKPEA
jgi:sodium/proline symporter